MVSILAIFGDFEILVHVSKLKDSEARRLEAESVQKTLAMELENAQLELESICKHKSLVRNFVINTDRKSI